MSKDGIKLCGHIPITGLTKQNRGLTGLGGSKEPTNDFIVQVAEN